MCETNHSLVNKIMVNYSLFVDERLRDKHMEWFAKDASWGLYLKREKTKGSPWLSGHAHETSHTLLKIRDEMNILPIFYLPHTAAYDSTHLLLHRAGGQKSDIGLPGRKSGCGQGCISFWRIWGWIHFLLLGLLTKFSFLWAGNQLLLVACRLRPPSFLGPGSTPPPSRPVVRGESLSCIKSLLFSHLTKREKVLYLERLM